MTTTKTEGTGQRALGTGLNRCQMPDAQCPAPRERPILFSAPMVRAILDNRKTQTRRIVKPQPTGDEEYRAFEVLGTTPCPYGQAGDRLWVRETWQYGKAVTPGMMAAGQLSHRHLIYGATVPDGHHPPTWRPSIHMPRWASRLTLEISSIRVERVQDITEADIVAEGWPVVYEWLHASSKRLDDWCSYTRRTDPTANAATKRGGFACFWDSINGKGSWTSNPWLWVVGFKRLQHTTDAAPSAAPRLETAAR